MYVSFWHVVGLSYRNWPSQLFSSLSHWHHSRLLHPFWEETDRCSVADETGRSRIVLWESDVGKLHIVTCYKVKRVTVWMFQFIKYLSMSDRAVVTAIGDIGEVADPPTDDEFPHANQVKLWVFHELRSTQAVSVARQKWNQLARWKMVYLRSPRKRCCKRLVTAEGGTTT